MSNYDETHMKDGTTRYKLNNKLHRLDGPAVELAGGGKEWWISGKQFTEAEFTAFSSNENPILKKVFLMAVTKDVGEPVDIPNFDEIHMKDGTTRYKLNDKLHRLSGPAVEIACGGKEWWIAGKQFTEAEFTAFSTCENPVLKNMFATILANNLTQK